MVSPRVYRVFVVVLLALLAASSSASVYLYQLRVNDMNATVAKTSDLNKQISILNSQIDSLRIQIRDMQSSSSSDQDSLKVRVALLESEVLQLQTTVDNLQATTSAQATEIQQLKDQVRQLQSKVQELQTQLQQLQAPPTILNGAGATFPQPFLSAVIQNYTTSHRNVQINYNGLGSDAGIANLIAKTIDFAASDAPLTESQRAAAPDSLTIPETIAALALAYNLGSTVPSGLELNATVLAMIFQGNITQWNDPAIQSLNPTITLPANQITIVHRSDASGTTFILTKYLNSSSNGVWKQGVGTRISWLVGLGAFGDQGEGGVILGNQYTIGYVELTYALQNRMATISLKNKAGTFVQPTLASVSYSVNNATQSHTLPAGDQSWTNVTLLNADGASSYPIVSFTYLLVYRELNVIPAMTLDKAKAIVDFLWFIVHDGQKQAPPLSYPTLPSTVVAIDETSVEQMTFNGQALHLSGSTLLVSVIGQQFSWTFTCVSPCDGSKAGELHIPHNTQITMNITSADVFHSIGIPAVSMKADAIKGIYTTLSFSVPIGTYRILCLQLCGSGHALMTANLIAE